MSNFFKHLRLILRHRHLVIKNAFHLGIFWQSLGHDLTKFSPEEFWTSVRYYAGDHTPIYEERLRNGYFSSVCQHHTKRNPHHWEYWTDYFGGRIVAKTMPYRYATEYVADMLSASYTYNPNDFQPDTTLNYFLKNSPYYYLTKATYEYVVWCLTRYAEMGFKGLKKKDTKKKYAEIVSMYPDTALFESLSVRPELPKLIEDDK